MSGRKTREFIPALNWAWLTPLYDPLSRWIMREEVFKGRLVRQVAALPGQRLLDLGCGTGTLTLLLKKAYPGSRVCGVDIDPEMLQRAEAKRARSGLEVAFRRGSATELPYPAASFDHLVSSLVIHHLKTFQKEVAAREVWRVLKRGGRLHLLDFGPPTSVAGRGIVAVVKHFEETADNFAGRVPQILVDAGFPEVREVDRSFSLFGPLVFYAARKPD